MSSEQTKRWPHALFTVSDEVPYASAGQIKIGRGPAGDHAHVWIEGADGVFLTPVLLRELIGCLESVVAMLENET